MRFPNRAGVLLVVLCLGLQLDCDRLCFGAERNALPPIEYVYPDQSIWTVKRNSQGVLENPLLQLAEKVFQEVKIPWSAQPFPANRMFERLETGKSNFSILVKASRLEECCIFSSKPVTFSELRVYRQSTSAPITKPEEFHGKTVILIRGYSYGKIGTYLRDSTNKVKTYEASKHDAAFEMLHYGRAEYLLDYSGPSEEILVDHPIPGITHDLLTRLNVYFVLSKKYPQAEETMKLFEKAADGIDVSEWGLKKP